MKKRGVAIAYDSHFSPEFAPLNLLLFLQNMVSNRMYFENAGQLNCHLQFVTSNCFAGIHDYCQPQPAPFNGYKVYGEDGGRLTSTRCGC